MNILFVTNKNVYPLIGGIERITYVLAGAFTQLYHWKCYSLFTQENHLNKTTNDVFLNKYLLPTETPVESISQIIEAHEIQIIIAQGADGRVNAIMPMLRDACNNSRHRPTLLFVFHNMPGFELVRMDVATLLHRLIYCKNKTNSLRQLILQTANKVVPSFVKRSIAPKYRLAYETADKMVMLSKGFITQYDQFVQGSLDHYDAIPNVLSYDIDEEWKEKKKKTILLVARMDERQKRVKLALRVWKKIQHENWQLKIIGDGEDLYYYKQLAEKWELKDLSFMGQQDPLRYYQEASIFIMTSAFEGWPMTLMEAMPCGCVPIAFDTYSAVHDIIQSGRNGYIIPEGDIDAYAAQLKELMNNDQLRNTLAQNAIKDVQRFSRENVAAQWKTLLESL